MICTSTGLLAFGMYKINKHFAFSLIYLIVDFLNFAGFIFVLVIFINDSTVLSLVDGI